MESGNICTFDAFSVGYRKPKNNVTERGFCLAERMIIVETYFK
jgi:hypothetical protein